MDFKRILKSLYPYLIGLFFGLVLVLIFFSPELQGKMVNQMDIIKHLGMAQDIYQARKDGIDALWTNRMFSGMPSFQITMLRNENIFAHIDKIFMLGMPRSSGFFFLLFMGFFFLAYSMKNDIWISLLGAFAFTLSTYFIIIIQAGHTSKAHAIGYVAPMIASIIMTYRGKLFSGAILTALFAGLHIMANHFQITYYVLFLVFFIAMGELIIALKEKKINNFIKASAILIVAGIFAMGPNMKNFLASSSYAEQTMRGTTELSFKEEQSSKSGLDKDYITAWSYGKDETLNLFIPNLKGGGSISIAETNKKALENVDRQYKDVIAQMGAYWGEQPFTSGPVYVGAFIFMLFILGLLLLRNWFVWSLLAVTILSILLAWGKNFMPLTDWFIDYFPLYNKFRTVSTFLVIPEFTIPLIAILGLKKIYDNPSIIKEKIKFLWISFGLTGGIAFLFWLMPSAFFSSFITSNDHQYFSYFLNQGATQAQVNDIMNNLEIARIQILKDDAIRSFFFIALGSALLFLWAFKKIKKEIFIAGLFIVVLADLIPINKRYLNEDHFISKRIREKPYQQTQADSYILSDKETNFRVINLAVNTFNDASTSYFHNSIGGYHAAKLQRYQDIIEYKLQNEINSIIKTFNNNPDEASINQTLKSLHGLNMLNTKYIIYSNSAPPILNPFRYGQAWFVDEIRLAENADEEMNMLLQTDVSKIAIINDNFSSLINDSCNFYNKDDNASITLTKYLNDEIEYNYSSKTPQCVIFSEVFYPDGWNAYINNEKIDVFRANYILRGLFLSEGNYDIIFKFEPKEYYLGEKISRVFSIIFLIIILTWIGYEIRNNFLKKGQIAKNDKKD